ncbi:MAG TPA: NfeD family protein [Gammaproteobacteria bacterium]|nr:NfeD family protein [Gammaproteobacteria bacterium]
MPPINDLGLALLYLGIALMLAELYLFTFGLFALSGLTLFVMGSVLFFKNPALEIAWPLVVGLGLATFIFILLVLILAFRANRQKVLTGKEALIGARGEVVSCKNGKIILRLHGELWQAQAEEPLEPGQKVSVSKVSGLELTIKPLHKNREG